MRRHVPVLIAITALLLTAGSCEGPDDVVTGINEFFDPVDLTKSKKPAEQAAGASADQVDAETKADQAVDDALASKDPDKLERAVMLRPRDPRYLLYQAGVEVLIGDFSPPDEDAPSAKSLHDAATVGTPQADRDRRWEEIQIEVNSRILAAYAGDPRATNYRGFLAFHCQSIERYKTEHGFSAEGMTFLGVINTSRC